MLRNGIIGAILVLTGSPGFCNETVSVAGHEVNVTDDGTGGAILAVDGVVLHRNGVIYLEPGSAEVAGVPVVTGAAGSGGNACNAAPFVLAFPASGEPAFFGPVDSCAYLVAENQGDRLLFVSESVSNVDGRLRAEEVWIWTPDAGFGPGPAFGALPAAPGWEALDRLSGAHPADAMLLTPVIEALQDGLGADFAGFAERIGGLGSGDLTGDGYLGSACIKLTCEADWAILYLHRDTQRVFAIWHVYGEIENRIYPEDTTLWPDEAMQILRGAAGE